MNGTRTYLDHNATTPLRPEARAAMLGAFDIDGNPSSVHAEGRRAYAVIETSREQVAALLGAAPREVVFTSGGTEANNAVLHAGWDAIVMAGIEHDSVLAPARSSGADVRQLRTNRNGVVELSDLDALLADVTAGRRRVLVSLQWANNETGALQPVQACAEIARRHGAALHSDAVQAVGKLVVDWSTSACDYLTVSAHKICGPKGVGALLVRQDGGRPLDLVPLTSGGGQERGRRAGTQNVAGIAGFGAAALGAVHDLETLAVPTRDFQRRIEVGVREIAPHALIIGESAPRLPNTSCIAVPGLSAETLVIALDLEGVAVSAGSACSSGKVKASHVLTAMGFGSDIAGSAIRVSSGWSTTAQDIETFLNAFGKVMNNTRLARKVA